MCVCVCVCLVLLYRRQRCYLQSIMHRSYFRRMKCSLGLGPRPWPCSAPLLCSSALRTFCRATHVGSADVCMSAALLCTSVGLLQMAAVLLFTGAFLLDMSAVQL